MSDVLTALKMIMSIERYEGAKKGPKMQRLLEEITEILYYYDPVGLAAIYCPEDEYDIEAIAILHRLRHVKDKTELRWMVYDVFVAWFDEDMTLPSSDKCYRQIADEIWDRWHEKMGVEEEEPVTITLTEAVTEILYKYDPLILVKFGLPDDEYTSEANDIISHLPHVSDAGALKQAIYEVFLNYYPPESIVSYRDERYQQIAEKTWNLYVGLASADH